jgi:hypothetical protein
LTGAGAGVVFTGGFLAVFAGAAFTAATLAAITLTVATFDAGFVAVFAGDDLAIGFFAAALLAGFLAAVLAAFLVDFDFIREDTLASLALEAKARVFAARLLAGLFEVLAALLERVVLFDTAFAWNRHAPVHGFFRGILNFCRLAVKNRFQLIE